MESFQLCCVQCCQLLAMGKYSIHLLLEIKEPNMAVLPPIAAMWATNSVEMTEGHALWENGVGQILPAKVRLQFS